MRSLFVGYPKKSIMTQHHQVSQRVKGGLDDDGWLTSLGGGGLDDGMPHSVRINHSYYPSVPSSDVADGSEILIIRLPKSVQQYGAGDECQR